MRVANKLRRRRHAQETLRKLLEHPDNVLLIHYSCESFYDRPEGASPRTATIAVHHLASGQTESFSVHHLAEEVGVGAADIGQRYAEVETKLLERFFRFVSRHSQHHWLHWNMRDINYGFAALEHRAQVLGLQPEHVPDSYKVDLARLLIDMYSPDYAPDPRMKAILKLNEITMRDFLTGTDEAAAFQADEFVKLHLSTLRKVDALASLAELADSGDIKTHASWWTRHGSSIVGAVDAVADNWIVKVLGVLTVIVGAIVGLTALTRWLMAVT